MSTRIAVSAIKISSWYLLILLLAAFIPRQGVSQTHADSVARRLVDSAGVAAARVDYAVPDGPAWKILDLDPSSILRPATVRDVAVSLSTINSTGGALEVSPALLLGNPSLSEYCAHPFLYRLRISSGVKLSGNGAMDYGVGVRLTIIDDADLRTDVDLTTSLVQMGHELGKRELDCTRQIPDELLNQPEQYGKALDSCLTSAAIGRFDTAIGKAREVAKARNWNKTLLEVGLAELASTPDSSFKRLQAGKYGIWSTLALPLLSTHGQLVIGAKALVQRDSGNVLNAWDGSVVVRGYFGKNTMKAFIEGNWETKSHQLPSGGGSIGAELSIGNGIWVDASFGATKASGQEAKFTSSLNVHLATPELALH